MSEKTRQILSTLLTGLLGGVIAIVILGLLALGPLQASGARINPFAETLPSCLAPPPPEQTCQSNEKMLGLALLQYYQDYDEKFPSGTQSPGANATEPTNGVGWAGQSFSYFRNGQAYHCPFDTTYFAKPAVAVSYAFNNNLASVSQAALFAPNLTVAEFEVGGDVVQIRQYDEGASQGASLFSAAGNGLDGSLFSGPDGMVTNSVHFATGYLGGRPPLSSGSQFTGATARDDGGTNVLVADGHVRYLPPSAVSSGSDATATTDPQMGGTTGTACGTSDLASGNFQITFSIR